MTSKKREETRATEAVVRRLRICLRCNDYAPRFQAIRTKLSRTSYKQTHKPVSPGVLEAYILFGKAQNGTVTKQDTRT